MTAATNETKPIKFSRIKETVMPARNKMRILYGLAFSMSASELQQAKVFIGKRLIHLREIDAPQVIIDNQIPIDEKYYALLRKAEERLTKGR